MYSTLMQKANLLRLAIFLVAAGFAFLIASPEANASYDKDSGLVACGKGRYPGLAVKARGNPVLVRAIGGKSGFPIIYNKFNTYSGSMYKVYYAQRKYGDHSMSWTVFTDKSEPNAWVSRRKTYGFCYNPW